MNLAQGANANFFLPEFQSPGQVEGRSSRGATDWAQKWSIPSEPAQPDGALLFIAEAGALFRRASDTLDKDIAELKKNYTFSVENAVVKFLTDHRGIRTVLRDALPPLKEFFRETPMFSLEVSADDDDSRLLYVVAIWQGEARAASRALDQFVDNWWLDRMNAANANLAFAYKLV